MGCSFFWIQERRALVILLKDIEEKLKELDPNVYYGLVDDRQREMVWDYIVFNRSTIKRSTSKASATDYFDVHIIRENYIPDGIDDEVVEKLCALPGVKLSGSDSAFAYVQKPNTNIVVEMLTISFARARKC